MRRTLSSTRGVPFCAAILALTFSAWGCDDDEDDPDHDDHGADGSTPHSYDASKQIGPPTGATCPDNSDLTYDNFGKDFMMKYCLRCHSSMVSGAARNGAPSDHNFDALNDIDLLWPHIDQYAGSGPSSTNTKMPPSNPKPSDDDRKKLSEWLACGPK